MDLETKEEIITIKNNLILLDIDDFKKIIDENELYFNYYINQLYELVQYDIDFILLSKQIQRKILFLLNYKRYQTNDSILKAKINKILIYINKINSITEEEKLSKIINYIENQEKIRNIIIESNDLDVVVQCILHFISKDIVVYEYLNDNFEKDFNEFDYSSSINYLLKEFNEIFDEDTLKKVKTDLKDFNKNNRKGVFKKVLSKYLRKTKGE